MIKTTYNNLSRQGKMSIDVGLIYYKDKEKQLEADLEVCKHNVYMYKNEQSNRNKIKLDCDNFMEHIMCKSVLDFVMKQEGLRLKAYKCPAGVLTIGYGHTNNGVGPSFDINTVWTKNDALFAFIADFQIAFDAVGDRSHGIITNCQQSVLASWTYNVGIGAMQRSTLMKCISKHQLYHVPRELARWDKANGKTIKGLTNRRKAEIKLWNECSKT